VLAVRADQVRLMRLLIHALAAGPADLVAQETADSAALLTVHAAPPGRFEPVKNLSGSRWRDISGMQIARRLSCWRVRAARHAFSPVTGAFMCSPPCRS
jgi:hypothetical protein